MNFINSLGEKRIEKHFTFSSSQEIKKEINNILKIYLNCNQELIKDLMSALQRSDNKNFTSTLLDQGSKSSLNIKTICYEIKNETLEDDKKSIKMFTTQCYHLFYKTIQKEKKIISDTIAEFDLQTKVKANKICTKKFPSIKDLNEALEEYNNFKLKYEKPLIEGTDIRINILNINDMNIYRLSQKEANWLYDKVISLKNAKDYSITSYFFEVGKNGEPILHERTPEEIKAGKIDSLMGRDLEIRETFKLKLLKPIIGDPRYLGNFTTLRFSEEINYKKQLKSLEKCSLIHHSFFSFLTHQTEAIQHVYKLFQEYNEMLDLEKEAEKKIREEMRKTAIEQKSELQCPSQEKEYTTSHNKKNVKKPHISKKEQIILESSQKSSESPVSKPTLPIIHTTDASFIEIFQAIMKGKDSKITWKEAIDCCSKLGYAITPCGGSIYKFVYQNSLKALIPENELDKFVESLQEEKIEKTEKSEEFKTSKNIHAPHREGQSHNEPLYPKLKNRFKLLFEETGFTLDHLKLEEKERNKKIIIN